MAAETSAQVRAAAAERGTALLAAPVSGNAKVVRAGKLSTAVSGPPEAFEAVRALLADIAGTVTYVGTGDTARLVKIAHNIVLGVLTQSLAEVLVLAERGGVPRSVLLEFLNGSVLGSVFTRYKSPALVNLDLTPTFTTELLRKDFDLGLQAGRRLDTPLPLASATARTGAAGDGPRPRRRRLRRAAAGTGPQCRVRAGPRGGTGRRRTGRRHEPPTRRAAMRAAGVRTALRTRTALRARTARERGCPC